MTNEQMATAELLATGDAFVTTLADIKKLISTRDARIAQLEAELDALAAAVIATPMPSIIENTEPFAQVPADSLLKLEWRAGRVYEWWATREGDVEFARRILAARDARMKREGAREALRGVCAKLIPAFSLEGSQYCKGWNDGLHSALGEVRAALAALEQKGGQG